jgi:hypothetical protein
MVRNGCNRAAQLHNRDSQYFLSSEASRPFDPISGVAKAA